MIVTTTNDVADHKIVRYLGVVRGVTVRSRNVFGTIGAQFQSLFGGNITLYTELAERARCVRSDGKTRKRAGCRRGDRHAV